MWSQTSLQCGQYFIVLASNSSHYHSADSAFDTNILLSHAVYPRLCRYGLVAKKIVSEIVSATSSHVQQCHTPGLVAVTKFESMKIDFEGLFGLSTKISPHENCPHTPHVPHLVHEYQLWVMSLTWQSRKFPLIKIILMPVVILYRGVWMDDGHGQNHRGSTANC